MARTLYDAYTGVKTWGDATFQLTEEAAKERGVSPDTEWERVEGSSQGFNSPVWRSAGEQDQGILIQPSAMHDEVVASVRERER